METPNYLQNICFENETIFTFNSSVIKLAIMNKNYIFIQLISPSSNNINDIFFRIILNLDDFYLLSNRFKCYNTIKEIFNVFEYIFSNNKYNIIANKDNKKLIISIPDLENEIKVEIPFYLSIIDNNSLINLFNKKLETVYNENEKIKIKYEEIIDNLKNEIVKDKEKYTGQINILRNELNSIKKNYNNLININNTINI